MKPLLAALFAVMIANHTFGLPAPYVMRGVAQGLCALAGLMWVFSNTPDGFVKKYWPVWGYLFCLLISVGFSNAPMYVFLQVGSLAGIIFFAVAFFEGRQSERRENLNFIVHTVVIIYVIVTFISIIVLVKAPGRAYEVETVHRRFRGLFSEPGMMANASGVLLGLSIFGIKHKLLKYSGILLGVTCIAFALSRTNWVAALFAIIVTGWFYHPQSRRAVAVFAVTGVLAVLVLTTLNVAVDTEKAEKIARTESISTLSGRTVLWQVSIRAMSRSPFFGNGFTTGIDALIASSKRREARYIDYVADLESRRGTIHNGYIQSLLDTGVVGTFFYIFAIIVAIRRLLSNDIARVYGPVSFLILYGSVANLGKNFIYSASVADSVLFWMLIIAALGVARAPSDTEPDTSIVTPKFTNLMGSSDSRDTLINTKNLAIAEYPRSRPTGSRTRL